MSLLLCQHDAYLRQGTAHVLAHLPHPDGVEVRLSAALLYPEGGGQPDDHGTIDNLPVRGLRRDTDGFVWHLLDTLPAADTVSVVVDWVRRFDHMQQHTAQHLISAIAADAFGAPTVAFHLREEVCDIDVDATLSARDVRDLEARVNAAIRDNRTVRARVADADELDEARTRGLPDGFSGEVRLIEIEGLDLNTCGGTHVAALGELQAISLMPPQKNKGGTKLRYLAGGRVLSALDDTFRREHALSTMLSCGPGDHAAAVKRIQDAARDTARAHAQLTIELAGLLGAALATQPVPHLHRDDADMAFLRAAASAAVEAAPERTVLLTGSELFMLAGPPDTVAATGPKIAALLGGRGGGARGRYQGRFASLDALPEALALI
jgi:misacylated tRNA(Ala) deacylase